MVKLRDVQAGLAKKNLVENFWETPLCHLA